MPSPRAQRGALVAALFALALTAATPGCLFAPDPCTDLLQCGGAGGSPKPQMSVTTGPGVTTTSGVIVHVPCTKDQACQGTSTPTCDPVGQFCRDCSTEDCRAAIGATCAADAACVSGRCVMGKCAACSANAQCSTKACASAACKAPPGAPCGVNTDCLGGECRFGLCRANISHPCYEAKDCFTGVCTTGTCQSCTTDADCPGTACGTGKELGRCLLAPGEGCWPDAQMHVSCFSGACAGFPATCQ